jgi:hypothetical protein
MSLIRVSQDARNPDQHVFSCDLCRLIEIRAPHDIPASQSPVDRAS